MAILFFLLCSKYEWGPGPTPYINSLKVIFITFNDILNKHTFFKNFLKNKYTNFPLPLRKYVWTTLPCHCMWAEYSSFCILALIPLSLPGLFSTNFLLYAQPRPADSVFMTQDGDSQCILKDMKILLDMR